MQLERDDRVEFITVGRSRMGAAVNSPVLSIASRFFLL